jgi:hypothetical protein
MKAPLKRVLFWTPRILGVLFVAFISLFALDVFESHQGFRETALALAMHLIPSAVLLLCLVLSWRWEWIGAAIFTALGVFYLVAFGGRFHWSAYAAISGPLFVLGLLFLINWIFHAEVRSREPGPGLPPPSASS